MTHQVTYFTDAPRINRSLSEILAQFKQMKDTGVSQKMMREHFLKDELLAIALWFAEKTDEADGQNHSGLFTQYEEIKNG